jgi:hypothetical protein
VNETKDLFVTQIIFGLLSDDIGSKREFMEKIDKMTPYKEECLLLTPKNYISNLPEEVYFDKFSNNKEESFLSSAFNISNQRLVTGHYQNIVGLLLGALDKSKSKTVVILTDDPLLLKGGQDGNKSTLSTIIDILNPEQDNSACLNKYIRSINRDGSLGLIFQVNTKTFSEEVLYTT